MYRLVLITETIESRTIRSRRSDFDTLIETTNHLRKLLYKDARQELDYEIIDYEIEHAQKIISMGDIDNIIIETKDEKRID
ncbi:MAG: hypothetical protein CXT73_02825 [Methanobacteriota archaeon]|jgi:hypothetical protein|nr:MAG: hypothetical protein CXT73_02825 [Euryarchaeota archaeon]